MRTACEMTGHKYRRYTATSDMCAVCATTVPPRACPDTCPNGPFADCILHRS